MIRHLKVLFSYSNKYFKLYKYDNVVIERKIINNNEKEVIIKEYNQSSKDLFFIDLLESELKENLELNIIQNLDKADYFITIHTTSISTSKSGSGDYENSNTFFVEIELLDNNRNLLLQRFLQNESCHTLSAFNEIIRNIVKSISYYFNSQNN